MHWTFSVYLCWDKSKIIYYNQYRAVGVEVTSSYVNLVGSRCAAAIFAELRVPKCSWIPLNMISKLASCWYFCRNEGSDFSGSIYQKVNDSLETAINVGWASTTNTTRFALGAKYVLDSDATLNAKVSNTSQFGIGYTQSLRSGENSVFFLFDYLLYKCYSKSIDILRASHGQRARVIELNSISNKLLIYESWEQQARPRLALALFFLFAD